jgi:hypothetical protein
MNLTEKPHPHWARERIAGYRAELRAAQPAAAIRIGCVTMAIQAGDYETAFAEGEELVIVLRRLRRLTRDAAGLGKALGAEEGEG